jgi:hypothetical protein
MLRELRFSRSRAQVMVIAAAAITILLGFTVLVINAGMFLTERRHLQNAADAAALAGAERVAEEQTSRSFRDARVLSAITTLARENAVDVGGNRQIDGTYLDQNGNALARVGDGVLPEASVAVEVRLSGPFVTMLPAFVGSTSLRVAATARAGLASVPFPSTLVDSVPLGVPLAAFQAGAAYDLYDQSVALASYGVSGYRPFLHLAHASNAGTDYQPGTDFGSLSIDLQFWSDGLHDSGQLGAANTIALANGSFADDVRAGLIDNVRRQGLVDANGASYALLDLPLWDQYQVGGTDTVRLAGFARFKIVEAEITPTSLRGYFVPYLLVNPPSGASPGVRWGPSRIAVLL